MGKKALYESIQLLEAKISAQSLVIDGLTSGIEMTKNSINPEISNSANYNIVLATVDRIKGGSRFITDIPEINLPHNKLEDMLYMLASLCFFNVDGEVKVTTFSKCGSLNGIGDLSEVIPIDLAGKSYDTKRTVVYNNSLVSNPCVIMSDYTGTYTENQIIPRVSLSAVSIKDEAEVYKQLKNNILITAKKAIAYLDSETQRAAIEKQITNILTNNNPIIGVVGGELKDLFKVYNLDTKLEMEGYLKAMEAYQRRRSNDMGIRTRVPVEKKENMLSSEIENDDLISDLILYDGLINRKVAIELMKKHSIIPPNSKAKCYINPILQGKSSEESDDNENDKSSDPMKKINSSKMEKGGV